MNVLIVISHLYMGGFSKSLINFLHCMQAYPNYDFTLLMLENQPTSLEDQLPVGIKIIRMDLEYKDSAKEKLRLEYYHYKYVFFELFNKHILKQSIPVRYVREYAMAKNAYRASRVVSDFSFTKEYDAVISWEEGFCNYVLAEKIPAGYKVGYIHPDYIEAEFAKHIDRRSLRKLDKIITISPSCYDTLRKVFPEYMEKIVCIPNRLNVQYYRDLAKQYVPRCDSNSVNLLTVARAQDSHKSIFRIVDLCNRLRKNDLHIKWYYIGDGPDFTELKQRITKSGLEDTIICLGALDNPCPYIEKADLYVQQSHYEGRPVSVDEALILHTPCLLTNYNSAKEQVENGVTGWITEDDEDALFEQLRTLLEHPELLKEARKKLSQRKFSSFEDCSAMIEMLNSLGLEKGKA